MASHAHSTRLPLLPLPAGSSALLRPGPRRSAGPVTLAIAAMRAADLDQAPADSEPAPVSPGEAALAALRHGLEAHFAEMGVTIDFDAPIPAPAPDLAVTMDAERARVRTLRQGIAAQLAADAASLDALAPLPDLRPAFEGGFAAWHGQAFGGCA